MTSSTDNDQEPNEKQPFETIEEQPGAVRVNGVPIEQMQPVPGVYSEDQLPGGVTVMDIEGSFRELIEKAGAGSLVVMAPGEYWDPISDIRRMHEHYGLNYDGPPRVLDVEEARFRGDFKLEEVEEWRKHAGRALMVLNTDPTDHAAITEELAEQLDALVDAMVIVLGTAYRQGMLHLIPEAWRRVLVANMAKEVGTTSRGFAADLVKPPGWTPPDHTDLVEEHAHR